MRTVQTAWTDYMVCETKHKLRFMVSVVLDGERLQDVSHSTIVEMLGLTADKWEAKLNGDDEGGDDDQD